MGKGVGSFEDRFVARLAEMGGEAGNAVITKELAASLKWQEKTFTKTREALIKKGIVKAETGRGGKTRLVTPPAAAVPVAKSRKLKVFISYSHNDQELKDALLAHLKPLERMGLIESWSDRSIKPGDVIDDAVKAQLEAADLFLLLISIDFINSQYCYEKESERALERHNAKTARVVPVILRACLWHHLPFGKNKALPHDGKAVTTYNDRDVALSEIASELAKLAKEFLEEQA